MGRKGRMGRLVPGARSSRRPACAGSDRQFRRQSASLGGRRKRGEKNQAIGRSRGGRTTKIHALTDAQCRPLAFMLTGGQIADCTAGAMLLEQLPERDILHADKGYDANALRRQVEGRLHQTSPFCKRLSIWGAAGNSRSRLDEPRRWQRASFLSENSKRGCGPRAKPSSSCLEPQAPSIRPIVGGKYGKAYC